MADAPVTPIIKGSWEDLLLQAEELAARQDDAAIPIYRKIIDRVSRLPTAQRMAGEFRVLVANILAEVIAKLFDAEYGYPPLAEPLAADGVMILSGILDERAWLVEAAAERHGLAVTARHQEGDWVALVLHRKAV